MNRYSTSRRGFSSSYRGCYGHSTQHQPQPRRIAAPLGQLLTTIDFDKLQETKDKTAEIGITDCKYIASYNLMEGLEQKIFVPGKPPAWTPLSGSTKLQQDSGIYYRDENAARFPAYPLEPAVKSIFTMNESFDTSGIDIFGCGSTLGDLLRFATGEPQPFTFIAHKIGKTVFFLRRNLSPTEVIEDVLGYGHSFPEAYTTWSQDVKGSGSHQRIVEYSFGGLKFLVRFEADGYVLNQAEDSNDDDEDEYAAGDSKIGEKSQAKSEAAIEDQLANLLRSKSHSTDASGQSLVIESKGCRTPQSSIFDLKTRAAYKDRDDVMEEQLPRLWVRQISKLVLAFHTKGVFDAAEVQDVSGEIADWEEKSKETFHRMLAVVNSIRDAAVSVDGGKLEVRGDESSVLQIRKLTAKEGGDWNALPEVLQEGWKRGVKSVS